MKTNEIRSKEKKYKAIIIVLCILLAITLTALIGVLLSKESNSSVIIPDNIITPEKEKTTSEAPILIVATSEKTLSDSKPMKETEYISLEFHKYNSDYNEPFYVENMFPGDAESKNYDIRVTYKGGVIIKFHADIRPGYEKLAEVLMCRVTELDTGNVMYDGLMRDMPASVDIPLNSDTKTTTDLRYQITGYLDTSVGNEYQLQKLIADFKWWAEGEKGQLEPSPSTGLVDMICYYWWMIPIIVALIFVVILIVKKKKQTKESTHDQK